MKTECGSYIITVKKKIISLQTVSCGNNLPFEQKVIFNIFSKFCVRNLFPHLTIWHWWLPQSCWGDVTASTSAPTPGEIGKSTLMRFYTHLRQRHGSHYRAIVSHSQTGLNVTSHPGLFSFCPDYESTGFLLWNFNGKVSEFLFFSTPERSKRQGRAWPHLSELPLIT